MIVEPIYEEILSAWGEEIQKVVIVEEISEFTKELTKILRKGFDDRKESFIIEFVDAILVLKQLVCMCVFSSPFEIEKDEEIVSDEAQNNSILGDKGYAYRLIANLCEIGSFVASRFEKDLSNLKERKKNAIKRRIEVAYKSMIYLKSKYRIENEIETRYREKILEMERRLSS